MISLLPLDRLFEGRTLRLECRSSISSSRADVTSDGTGRENRVPEIGRLSRTGVRETIETTGMRETIETEIGVEDRTLSRQGITRAIGEDRTSTGNDTQETGETEILTRMRNESGDRSHR